MSETATVQVPYVAEGGGSTSVWRETQFATMPIVGDHVAVLPATVERSEMHLQVRHRFFDADGAIELMVDNLGSDADEIVSELRALGFRGPSDDST